MITSPLMVTTLVVALLAALWKTHQLARAPHGRALRTVTALVWLFLLDLLVIASPGPVARWLGAGSPVLIWNASSFVFSFLMVAFFVAADRAHDARTRARRVRRELAVVLAASAVMAVCAATLPVGDLPVLDEVWGDMTTGQAAVFAAVGTSYRLYAGLRSSGLAVGYARRADRGTALGLRIFALGEAASVVLALGRLVTIAIRARGGSVPAADDAINRGLLLCFLVIFAGLTLPGLLTRYRAARRRLWHLRAHRRMTTLWRRLEATFPEGTLERSPATGHRTAWRSVDRRCYRRAIECRDGLVRVGPHLAARGVPDDVTEPDVVAAALPGALADHRRGRRVDTAPIRVLPPRGDGLDDDVSVLVALSHALDARALDAGSEPPLAVVERDAHVLDAPVPDARQ